MMTTTEAGKTELSRRLPNCRRVMLHCFLAVLFAAPPMALASREISGLPGMPSAMSAVTSMASPASKQAPSSQPQLSLPQSTPLQMMEFKPVPSMSFEPVQSMKFAPAQPMKFNMAPTAEKHPS